MTQHKAVSAASFRERCTTKSRLAIVETKMFVESLVELCDCKVTSKRCVLASEQSDGDMPRRKAYTYFMLLLCDFKTGDVPALRLHHFVTG